MQADTKGEIHFVCRGECGGVSKTPGSCKAEECSKKGLPLDPCHCTDGSHEKDEDRSHG